MARAGRKRNPNAKRRQKTAKGQGRGYTPTPERLEHFKRATGRDMRNNWDNGDATVIHILRDQRKITDEQKSAALGYAELYWHFVGNIFRQDRCVTFAKQLVGRGSVVMPSDILDQASEEREERFKELDSRLRETRKIIHKVVLDEKQPKPHEMDILKLGLNRLVGR